MSKDQNHQLPEKFSSQPEVDFRLAPSISLQAIELEEAILGAILFDPDAIAAVERLSVKVFSISAHQKIFSVMLELHNSGLKPNLPTVALRIAEQGSLESVGGQSKLAQLLDRTVHSASIKQYAQLLEAKYLKRYLRDRLCQIAEKAANQSDIGVAIDLAQSELEEMRSVTSDTAMAGDSQNVDPVKLQVTVATVTKIIGQGLKPWQEMARLDDLQLTSGISKASFWELVASLRTLSDEVMPEDSAQLNQLIDWKNVTLDFTKVLPHMASDLLHDARVLNIDPIMLWSYLLPATLSLVGKRVNLDVGSHLIPAIIWSCIVGESGIGKSRAEGLILAYLRTCQLAEYHRFKPEWTEYKKSLNQNQKKNSDSEPVEPPIPERKYLFEVTTIQALMRRLSEQDDNGSLWARDEIAGLFKSLGQFAAKGEGEGLECLLPMWDGTGSPVDRVLQEDSYHLESSRLSISGGIQPGVFRKTFSDPDDAQGLQARFLFAVPKVQPTKVVEGYCHLSDKLPAFYRWVDTQFPAGNVKLSRAAKARYNMVYESIGRQAETAATPAIRAWMRKLPGQLLRIALGLHIIECYHEANRPRHELQIDTLNRAVEFCRYYRSTFEVVQQSATDSDDISSVLLKIWDMAATSPAGLAVRDAYRNIKALSRRAKSLGRNVGAYTIDLYYQLEKMGKGRVHKEGRVIRFVAGETNPPPSSGGSDGTPNPPSSPNNSDGTPNSLTEPLAGHSAPPSIPLWDDGTPNLPSSSNNGDSLLLSPPPSKSGDSATNLLTETLSGDNAPFTTSPSEAREGVTVVPVKETTNPQGLEVSPLTQVSPVTLEEIGQVDLETGEITLPISLLNTNNDAEQLDNSECGRALDALTSPTSRVTTKETDLSIPRGIDDGVGANVEQCKLAVAVEAHTVISLSDDAALISETELQSWLDRFSQVTNEDDCTSCWDALNQLPTDVVDLLLQRVAPVLPRFWSVARNESLPPGKKCEPSAKTAQNTANVHATDSEVGDRATTEIQSDLVCANITPEQPITPDTMAGSIKDLFVGLWARTTDGFYGHLRSMLPDGRWWIVSPKTRTTDTESRLVDAADIIPMPTV